MGVESLKRIDLLEPFVARLVIDWERSTPEHSWREIDGTLVFADISGFTAMTERLSRRGRVGAEEMNDILNGVFAELLTVAYDHSAELVKWGGDAMLLLYQGDGHAQYASRAAMKMQRTIRRVGRVRSSAGSSQLLMSIGVHSGTFHMYLVGDPEIHRELVIAGPASTRAARMQDLAKAREVLLSRQTAARLDPVLLGESKGSGILLAGVPELPLRSAAPASPFQGVDLARLIPVAIREHLVRNLFEPEPEHRRLVASFMEFMGSDDMLRTEGPARVGAAIDECVRCVQRATERNGVSFFETDISKNAWRVFLLAGCPTSLGQDDERMLQTVREIAETSLPFPVKIGVNGGPAFAANFGTAFRRTFSVKGDTVNVAARLMAKAEAGEIYATEAVLRSSHTQFDLRALSPLSLKGKSGLIQAFSVGPAKGLRAKDPAQELPLLGREQELAEINNALQRARSGRGSLVQLVGEAGIGKTRLVNEAVRHAEGLTILSVTCEGYRSSTAYYPFRCLLLDVLGVAPDADPRSVERRLRDRVRDNAPELLPWLPLLGVVLDVTIAPSPETQALEESFVRRRVEETTYAFLRSVCSTPTLLFFDDVHFMDEASCALLNSVATRLEREPWAVLITRRDSSSGYVQAELASVSTVALEPLSRPEVVSLVEIASEDAPLPTHDIQAIAERSAGNPLFVHALLSAVRATGWTDELPESIEGVMTARIDSLPSQQRSLLGYASILGTTFSKDMLKAVFDFEPRPDDVREGLSQFLVQESHGRLRFQNALVRDGAYARLPFRRRKELHARAGDWIKDSAADPGDESDVLSLHFFRADRFDEAWRFSRIAAQHAASKFANIEAATLFQRALDAAARLDYVSGDDIAAVSESLGDAWDRAGEFARAEDAYRAARRHVVDDPVRAAGLLLKQAWIPERLGRLSDALRWVTRGLRVLDGVEGVEAVRQRAQLSVWYAAIRQSQGRPADAINWCERAIEDATSSGDREALAHAYFVRDWAVVALGREDVPRRSREALEIYESLGDLRGQAVVLNNLGAFAYWEGRWDEAIELYKRGRDARERTGDSVNAATGTCNIAEVLLDQGRREDAWPLLHQALRVWKAAADRFGVAFVTRLLGRLASMSGRFDEADQLFSRARDEFLSVGSATDVFETEVRIAESLVLRHKPARALDVVAATLERVSGTAVLGVLEPLLRRVRACALMQLGRLEEAEPELAASLQAARERSAQYEIGLTLRALVDLARLKGTTAHDADSESREILSALDVIAVPEFAYDSVIADSSSHWPMGST